MNVSSLSGSSSPSRVLSWLTGAATLLALTLFGMLAGGLVATRVLPISGMGWDQLAAMLAGLLAGAAAGLVAGVMAVRMFESRGRVALSALALLGCVAAILYLLATPANVRPMSLRRGFATDTSPRHDG